MGLTRKEKILFKGVSETPRGRNFHEIVTHFACISWAVRKASSHPCPLLPVAFIALFPFLEIACRLLYSQRTRHSDLSPVTSWFSSSYKYKGRAGILGHQRAQECSGWHSLPTEKMKTSIAALSVLILAAQAAMDLAMMKNVKQHSIQSHGGFHRPADCCFSYTPRKIQCVNMKDYTLTTSECSKPAVIFLTKKGQRVCTNPDDEQVQKCMSELKLTSTTKDLKSILLKKEHFWRRPPLGEALA
uniref:C-C motif chemokine n=2 Tax=Sus scrofa TaxID=9823 RepID=A0A8D0X6E5_PIG